MRVLLSGFTVFGSHGENSSQIITERFKETKIPGLDLHTAILPVAFSSSFDHLKIEIDSFRPDVVICLGLAESRQKIEIEKVALNLIHCNQPDNEGVLLQDRKILEHGPDAYFSTLPIKAMRETQGPFPKEMSLSAGAYVCNYVMYRVLNYTEGKGIRAGFIHLPHLKENEEKIFSSMLEMLKVLKK